jgi:signal transduction histidine kinase
VGLDYDPTRSQVGSGLSVVRALIETEMGGRVDVRRASPGTEITVLSPITSP